MESTLNPDGDASTAQVVVLEMVVPALAGTAVYWYVAGATAVEVGIFAAVFLATMAAIKYVMGRRGDED